MGETRYTPLIIFGLCILIISMLEMPQYSRYTIGFIIFLMCIAIIKVAEDNNS